MIIEPSSIQLQPNLSYKEWLVQIIDRKEQELRNQKIPLVKVLYAYFRGNIFLQRALLHKEQEPLHDLFVWRDATRLCVLSLNQEAELSHTVEARARRYTTFENSNTFTNCK